MAPVLRGLISPTKTRARIYDRDGVLLLDSRDLLARGDFVLRFDLPPPQRAKPGLAERSMIAFRNWLNRGDLPPYRELGPENGKGYYEVAQSLSGTKGSAVRVNDRGEVIVSVAVPVQRWGQRAINGSLMLSTQGDDIDQMVTAERIAILRVFGVAAAVMIVLSILLASTIAGPVSRLADSAEHVRRRIKARIEIPDFTRRRDEIGHLSRALREMTDSLYNRIEGIERFAADVAHELKNPLTSLRSAVETLPLARNDASRARLLSVIEHDVRRLDRLISDISDASRLDAELQRQDVAPVDMRRLLTTLVTVPNETRHNNNVSVQLHFEGASFDTFLVPGHDSRLGQVISTTCCRTPAPSRPTAASCASPAAACAARSRSWSTTKGQASAPTRWKRFLSAFTPTARTRGLARIRASAFRSPSRSSRRMAGRSGRRTGPERRTRTASRRSPGARFVVRLPAI